MEGYNSFDGDDDFIGQLVGNLISMESLIIISSDEDH